MFSSRDYPLNINLCVYRLLYIGIFVWQIRNFKFRPASVKVLARLLAVLVIQSFLLYNAESFTAMLSERVESIPTMNDGIVYEFTRYTLAHLIFQIVLFSTWHICGYKGGYVCDIEKCQNCLLPGGKHPPTWKVDMLEYQAICMTLFYPMAYIMALSQVWFDTTDFGSFFFHSSSLVTRTLPNATITMPDGPFVS